jgi:hypothetical protein
VFVAAARLRAAATTMTPQRADCLERIPVEWNDVVSTNSALSFPAKAGNPVLPGISWDYWIARFRGRRHRSDSIKAECAVKPER